MVGRNCRVSGHDSANLINSAIFLQISLLIQLLIDTERHNALKQVSSRCIAQTGIALGSSLISDKRVKLVCSGCCLKVLFEVGGWKAIV